MSNLGGLILLAVVLVLFLALLVVFLLCVYYSLAMFIPPMATREETSDNV